MQFGKRLPRRGGHLFEVTPHAAAHVEQQDRVERLGFVAEVEDLLRRALVVNDEVVFGEAAQRAGPLAYLHVHADPGGGGAEEGRLLLRGCLRRQ